jgi:hypothetical protein
MERERGMVVGGRRGCAVTVSVPACSGASQLIRGVRWTCASAMELTDTLHD